MKLKLGSQQSAVAFLLLLGICDAAYGDAVTVELAIRDKKSGQAMPCRIHVKDSAGKPQRAGDLPFWFDHVVSSGTAQLQLNPGKYTIEIERGPEFVRIADAFEVKDQALKLAYEMERLADPSSFAFPPEDAWKRLKAPGRNPQVLGRLKALAAWRETEARNKNLPRGRIVKDETLGELSSHPPKSQEDLGRIRGLSAGWKTNDIGARMMAALADARPLGPADLPDREPRRPGL